MIYIKDKIGYLVILLFVFNVCYCQRSKLNTRCKMRNTGFKGTCLQSTDCPRVQEDAERGIQPTKCGQYSNVIIVCCQGAHPIFNTPPPPNEISLLNLPDGLSIVYPGTGEGGAEPTLEEQMAEGFKASQKCREYLPVKQFSLSPLAINNDPITVNITKCSHNGVALIVGGTDAKPGEFPFMAAIGWPNGEEIKYGCGGTLISDLYVLTAAHCSFQREGGKPTVVRVGATNIAQSEQNYDPNAVNYRIADFKIHEEYNGITHYNDIALVRLHRRIPRWTDYIRPACLWIKNSFDTTHAIVAGWGQEEEAGERSEILKKVTLNLFTKDVCSKRYMNMKKLPQGITDGMICSGYLPGGRDTCQGDSGGPLLTKKIDGSCEYYIIGITSFGIGCAKVNTPGLYTKVSTYLGWIENIVWP